MHMLRIKSPRKKIKSLKINLKFHFSYFCSDIKQMIVSKNLEIITANYLGL